MKTANASGSMGSVSFSLGRVPWSTAWNVTAGATRGRFSVEGGRRRDDARKRS